MWNVIILAGLTLLSFFVVISTKNKIILVTLIVILSIFGYMMESQWLFGFILGIIIGLKGKGDEK